MDGSIEPRPGKTGVSRKRTGGDLCAIFVHAGAGYHSVQNERVHLGACEDAARTAMTFLKNGGSAVDAIEAAIKVLEDNEITNAGYGSNLSMDGSVEGDATIVDYLGRAGAVGAIGNVINPIHVARLLLDESTKPLSLKRVPPNLLVGQGAVDYAYLHKVPILPNDALVSPAAKDRWAKWSKDLRMAHEYVEPSAADLKDIAALRNEGQLYSPLPSTEKPIQARSPSRTWDRRPNGKPSPLSQSSASSNQWEEGLGASPHNPVIIGDSNDSFDPLPGLLPAGIEDWGESMTHSDDHASPSPENLDLITDTVGAIAIDCHGRMAAGSSSGGIGMKYKGRIGPAALVGVGSSVYPVNPKDKDETCVGAVTSGTGEHMATTMAASTCASRLYYNQAMSKNGVLEDSFEEDAMQNFIKHDFMKHPSVDSSHSVGAIGVMAVKKTVEGIWLHFAHNTDSFALASMTSDDFEPSSVMSRSKTGSTAVNCTTGGRAMHHTEFKRGRIPFKRQKQSRSDPEPANNTGAPIPRPPVAVYTGHVHPDGNSLMLWEPMVEDPMSRQLRREPQHQSYNPAEHNENMSG